MNTTSAMNPKAANAVEYCYTTSYRAKPLCDTSHFLNVTWSRFTQKKYGERLFLSLCFVKSLFLNCHPDFFFQPYAGGALVVGYLILFSPASPFLLFSSILS